MYTTCKGIKITVSTLPMVKNKKQTLILKEKIEKCTDLSEGYIAD